MLMSYKGPALELVLYSYGSYASLNSFVAPFI
jgi:hypothetical protein